MLKDWANGDVHLLYGSPAVDEGDGSVIQTSSTDFYGNIRVATGNPNGSSVVDIGAVEYSQPAVIAVDGTASFMINVAGKRVSQVAGNGVLHVSGADPNEPLVFSSVTQPAHGTLTITDAAAGSFKYTPAPGYIGTDGFEFQITDPYGTVSNTATEQLTVADTAPTAMSSVLGGLHRSGFSGTLKANAAYKGQVLQYQIVTPPAHGIVTIRNSSRGGYRYTPTRGYRGADSFSFEVVDQWGTPSNVATISFND